MKGILEMLKLTKREKQILDALLVADNKTVALKLGIPLQTTYNTVNYFRRKVQNAQEFLAATKSKYKKHLRKRLDTPRIMPESDEEEDW